MRTRSRRSAAASYAILILAVGALGVILVLGRGSTTPETITGRADRIGSEIRCPTCQGLSVKDSKAASARVIFSEIERQLESGETDENIRAYLVDRFGTSELLRPQATGIASIVWIAPVMFVVLALVFLAVVFLRRRPGTRSVTDEDRALVEAALAGSPEVRSP